MLEDEQDGLFDVSGYESVTPEAKRRNRALAQEAALMLEQDMAQDERSLAAPADAPPAKTKLQRELRAEALLRLETAARTPEDFQNVLAWWDRLDANRERRERYHEISRSGQDIPIDYGAAIGGVHFPDSLGGVLEQQVRQGDYLDVIFYCPFEVYELVTAEHLSKILRSLSDDQKEVLFLSAVRQFSASRIAAIRNQTDRNIRKLRLTLFRRIQKQLLVALQERADKQQPLTLEEKLLLAEGYKPN